jgi:hypothetical protein
VDVGLERGEHGFGRRIVEHEDRVDEIERREQLDALLARIDRTTGAIGLGTSDTTVANRVPNPPARITAVSIDGPAPD